MIVIAFSGSLSTLCLSDFCIEGKISNSMGVMNLLQTKFETLQIERSARDGAISEQEYEDKIKEAFRQMGIELNEE